MKARKHHKTTAEPEMVRLVPPTFRAALDEVALASSEAHDLAEVLNYFVLQLCGAPAEPEGPPIERCPQPAQVRRALERRDNALKKARAELDRLPEEVREWLVGVVAEEEDPWWLFR